MLGWLVDRDINPHIPVLDKAGRTDGTWNPTDFELTQRITNTSARGRVSQAVPPQLF